MRDRLSAYGLFHEIISWKLRMFVPIDTAASAVLAKVLERYPVARIVERAERRHDHARTCTPNWRIRLAREAEAVCRHYLSNGRREGRYWLVGDVSNTPGRSMFVRLKGLKPARARPANGPMPQPANTATCSTSSARRCGLADFHDVADEARRFLSLPRPEPDLEPEPKHQPASAPAGSPESARRLFAMSQPITGTIVEAYLRDTRHYCFARNRSLRFHPRCYYRPDRRLRRPRPGRR